MICATEIKVGSVYTDGTVDVKVAVNHGLNAGLRLDQEPHTGMAYVSWFRSEKDVAEFLTTNGFSLKVVE